MRRLREWIAGAYETAHLWLFDHDTYRWLASGDWRDDEGLSGFVEAERP